MAIERVAGFEYGTQLEYDELLNISYPSTSNPRTGNYSLQMSSMGVSYIGFSVTGRNEYYIQAAFRFGNSQPSNTKVIWWMSGATILGALAVQSDMVPRLYLGNLATLLDTAAAPLSLHYYYVFEVHVKLHNTSGVLEVRQDGQTILQYAGDTAYNGLTTMDRVRAGCGAAYVYIDDVVILNTLGTRLNSWPNGMPVYCIRPNEAGAAAEWTPEGAADNYDCVDETPPSTTYYVWTRETNKADIYGLAAAPSALQTGVSAVLVDLFMSSVGESVLTGVNPIVRVGTTNYEGDTLPFQPSLRKASAVWEVNPATGQPWTKEELDNLQIGFRSV